MGSSVVVLAICGLIGLICGLGRVVMAVIEVGKIIVCQFDDRFEDV